MATGPPPPPPPRCVPPSVQVLQLEKEILERRFEHQAKLAELADAQTQAYKEKVEWGGGEGGGVG